MSGKFAIVTARSAQGELELLRAFDERRVVDAIRSQLSNEPLTESRNRKCLDDGLKTDFDFVPPLWQLRVRLYRVFYGVDKSAGIVIVHAVRLKPPHKSTQEVTNEDDSD